MQHGPETPSKSTPQTDEPVLSPQEQDLSSADGQTEQESGSESFFETLGKGQDKPLGPSMLFMGGVLLALLVIMRSVMKSSAKRKLQTRTMGDTTERIDKINTRAKGSMDPARQAMVDAENLTRRMGAVLDNKAAKIEVLLQEANERIAQLEQAAAQSTAPNPAPSPLPNASVPPEALDRARLDQDREDRQWVDEDRVVDKPKPKEEPIFRIDRGINAKPIEESPHPLTFPEQVDELATQGLNALEIANKLNRAVGEVELVLNLRRNSG